MELTTTLNKILAKEPCTKGWNKLVLFLGKDHLVVEVDATSELAHADDDSLPFSTILVSNGLDDALWSARSAPEYHKQWRHFAVWSARQVQHLLTDARSLQALDVAECYANGLATDAELTAELTAARAAVRESTWEAAWDAARAAARAAAWAAARDATGAAAGAAARDAAVAAARDAAWAAARAAAGDAAGDAAGEAAWDAARAAAGEAARESARAAQVNKFLEIVGNT